MQLACDCPTRESRCVNICGRFQMILLDKSTPNFFPKFASLWRSLTPCLHWMLARSAKGGRRGQNENTLRLSAQIDSETRSNNLVGDAFVDRKGRCGHTKLAWVPWLVLTALDAWTWSKLGFGCSFDSQGTETLHLRLERSL